MPAIGLPDFGRFRIAARREDDADEPVGADPDATSARSAPVAAATSSGSSGSSMSGRITCVSGSPSRTLNSITFGPSGVSIRPTNRKPRNGWPSAAMPAITGSTISRMTRASSAASIERTRREGAHPAGVRTAVVVEDPLVILRGASCR